MEQRVIFRDHYDTKNRYKNRVRVISEKTNEEYEVGWDWVQEMEPRGQPTGNYAYCVMKLWKKRKIRKGFKRFLPSRTQVYYHRFYEAVAAMYPDFVPCH